MNVSLAIKIMHLLKFKIFFPVIESTKMDQISTDIFGEDIFATNNKFNYSTRSV